MARSRCPLIPLVRGVLLGGLFIGFSLTAWANAQVSRLDKGRLIQGLAKRDMSELLDRLLETDPPRNDVERAEVRIQQSLMAYRDPGLSAGEQRSAFQNALKTRRQLIGSHPNDRRRAIWAVDLAQLLLISRMEGVGTYADLFYEFGIPSAQQRTIFAHSAVEALEALTSAQQAIFHLRGRLARDDDLREQMQASGLFYRIEDYAQVRIPFYLARAAYDVSLLANDHAYYSALSSGQGDPKIPGQAKTPQAERTRLLNEAYQRIEPLANDTADPYGIATAAKSLAGRIQIARGNPSQGIEQMLEPLINDAGKKQTAVQQNPAHLAAALGKAHGLTVQGKFGPAQELLTNLTDHRFVTRHGDLLRLLVTDARHRAIMAEVDHAPSNQRAAMRSAAYQPYERFLAGIADQAQRSALRNYIFQRWANRVPSHAQPDQYPPFERMAIGEIARMRAQGLIYNEQGQVVSDQPRRDKAANQAQRAVAFNHSLTDGSLEPNVRGRGMFNLAGALYVREVAGGNQSVDTMLRVVDLMTTVAGEMPDQPIARQSMQNAIAFARQLRVQDDKSPAVARAYRKTAKVLFDQYGQTKIANQERVYYAYHVLQQNGRYAKAAKMYNALPRTSADYFEAKRRRLWCLQQLAQQAKVTAKREEAWQNARQAAEQTLDQAEAAHEQNDNGSARGAAGAARLVLAQIALNHHETERVLNLLKHFETRYKDEPDLVQRGLEKRIMALVDGQRLKEAADQARIMMKRFPRVGASVVSEILDNFEQRIDTLLAEAKTKTVERKRAALEGQASKIADTAVSLANALFDWAKGRDMSPKQLLAYQLILSKSLRLTGEQKPIARSRQIMQSIMDQPKLANQGQVVLEAADSFYAAGRSLHLENADDQNLSQVQRQHRRDLVRARRLYNRLITATRQDPGPTFWHAWTRTLSITAKLADHPKRIPQRVRQLEQAVDPNLGGPEFKPKLERLRDKYE